MSLIMILTQKKKKNQHNTPLDSSLKMIFLKN